MGQADFRPVLSPQKSIKKPPEGGLYAADRVDTEVALASLAANPMKRDRPGHFRLQTVCGGALRRQLNNTSPSIWLSLYAYEQGKSFYIRKPSMVLHTDNTNAGR